MNFWTFLDRNIDAVVLVSCALLLCGGIAVGTSGNGCSIRIGDQPAAVDGGAP